MIVASAQSYVSLFTLASAAAYLLAATLTHVREHIGRSGAVALAIAWGCQAVALWLGLTQPPRFGFGPALSMTACVNGPTATPATPPMMSVTLSHSESVTALFCAA